MIELWIHTGWRLKLRSFPTNSEASVIKLQSFSDSTINFNVNTFNFQVVPDNSILG